MAKHLLWKTGAFAPSWGTRLRTHYCEVKIEKERDSTQQDSNPWPLDHKACTQPLCYYQITSTAAQIPKLQWLMKQLTDKLVPAFAKLWVVGQAASHHVQAEVAARFDRRNSLASWTPEEFGQPLLAFLFGSNLEKRFSIKATSTLDQFMFLELGYSCFKDELNDHLEGRFLKKLQKVEKYAIGYPRKYCIVSIDNMYGRYL